MSSPSASVRIPSDTAPSCKLFTRFTWLASGDPRSFTSDRSNFKKSGLMRASSRRRDWPAPEDVTGQLQNRQRQAAHPGLVTPMQTGQTTSRQAPLPHELPAPAARPRNDHATPQENSAILRPAARVDRYSKILFVLNHRTSRSAPTTICRQSLSDRIGHP